MVMSAEGEGEERMSLTNENTRGCVKGRGKGEEREGRKGQQTGLVKS